MIRRFPVGTSLQGVDGDHFCAYYDKIKKHRDDAALALAEEDQDDATKYWRRIFGDRFPAPKSTATSMLKSAATMSPLTFKATPGCTVYASGKVCVSVWWIDDPERLSAERRAIDAISEDWFENSGWSLDGELSTEADLRYRVAAPPVPAIDDLSQYVPGFAA